MKKCKADLFNFKSLIIIAAYCCLGLLIPFFCPQHTYCESDISIQTVQKIQESAAPKYRSDDAEQQAQAYIVEHGLYKGWNDNKDIFIAIGLGFFDIRNPRTDKSFLKLRSLKSLEAMLDAKIQIIEYANSIILSKDTESIRSTNSTYDEKLTSEIGLIAKMPLIGAVTVAQFESWNPQSNQYKMALVVGWSKTMEKYARYFLLGKPFSIQPGSQTISEWINNQDWSTAAGSRRFRDKNGTVHIIGIGAMPTGKTPKSIIRARKISQQLARREVATAIFADVESQKYAAQIMQTTSDELGMDKSKAKEMFTSKMKQKIDSRRINGLNSLFNKKLQHPISKQPIYVSIFGISSQLAKKELLKYEKAYIDKTIK